MIMNLGPVEIEAAIKKWVHSEGISLRDKTIDIQVKSGRKGNGPTAVVTIENIKNPPVVLPADIPLNSEDEVEENLFKEVVEDAPMTRLADLGDLS